MQVKIEKLDSYARGITRINDKICFVENALPLEECEIEITNETKKYLEAKNINLIKEFNYRIMPLCPYYSICGGCHTMHMDRKEELIFKEEKVSDLLNKFSRLDNINLKDIVYGNEFYYRNKITLHIKDKKIGLYKEKTNEVIEITECLITNHKINNIIKRLKDNISLLDKGTEIIIKTTSQDETMLIINGKANKEIINSFKDIDSIYIDNKLVYGKEYIIEKINDLTFYIYKDSFFQINYEIMLRLYNKIIDYYKEHNNLKVLDLYCGTGTIGMLISKYCKEVIGVEVNSDAINSANKCKDVNNIKNISFYSGKVEDNIDKFKNIDSIIVDPPRSGLDKFTIDNIIKINPSSIIYVSCDPVTLARDLNILKEKYNILEATPFDMFPNTYHVENLVILKRK